MTVYGVFLILYHKATSGELVALIIPIISPVIGLAIRERYETISRGLILMSLPLVCLTMRNLFSNYFFDFIEEKYFILGNEVGLLEIILITNIRSFEFKIGVALEFLAIKVVILLNGFTHSIGSIVVTILILTLLLMTIVYQEMLARKQFKSDYGSQEMLKKFQSLLSEDFPVGVLIMNSDFDSVLYSNMFFQNQFVQRKCEKEIAVDSIFKDFELEINLGSFGLEELEGKPLSLATFIKSLNTPHFAHITESLIVLPAVYRSTSKAMTFHYEIKISKITWDHIPSYALIFSDVSQKHMVTALKMVDEQKDRILATISHELRTPINGTLGLLEMISARINDEVIQTYLTYCKSCNKLLLYLVNSILDLCALKTESLKIIKDYFNLDELLEEIKSLYQYQCQAKNIEFIIEKEEYVPTEIYSDRYRLAEVLVSLISNGIKFTFEGSVTLKIDLDKDDMRKLSFSIIDTGTGIEEEDKPSLLKRFCTIQRKPANINLQGAGLGLTIVQELVAALNNDEKNEKITFESVYGEGSIFLFRILYKDDFKIGCIPSSASLASPLSISKTSSIVVNEFSGRDESVEERLRKYDMSLLSPRSFLIKSVRREDSVITNNMLINHDKMDRNKIRDNDDDVSPFLKNVLIVDDNPFNILAASFILEKFNSKIDKVFNGQECINIVEKNNKQGKQYDLILMDIQMPILDGPEATKILTNKMNNGELRRVPVIALTAKKSTEEEKKYYKSCGLAAILEKPLKETELIKTIKYYVNQ